LALPTESNSGTWTDDEALLGVEHFRTPRTSRPRKGSDGKGAEMAYAGQTLDNPVSGEQIVFKKTAADTDGEYLEIELRLAPDGKVPGMHVHPEQEERFEVLAGRMRFRMGMKTIDAGPGDVVTVPAGKAHKFANAGEETAVVYVTVTPALEMERLFETTAELAREGRVLQSGMPKPLDLALFVREFKREVRGPFSPGALQRAMLAPLAKIAEARGRDELFVAARPVLV
jgi:mannose-6-phosphate isomerase-like protein (cupin superfamily)